MAKTQKRSAARGTRRGRRAGSPRRTERAGAGEERTRKNFNLYQSKIDLAREILGTGTETDTIDQALDLVIVGEQLAQGTRRARGRAFHDLFGEAEAATSSSAGG